MNRGRNWGGFRVAWGVSIFFFFESDCEWMCDCAEWMSLVMAPESRDCSMYGKLMLVDLSE